VGDSSVVDRTRTIFALSRAETGAEFSRALADVERLFLGLCARKPLLMCRRRRLHGYEQTPRVFRNQIIHGQIREKEVTVP
jgi:hypothetical protein